MYHQPEIVNGICHGALCCDVAVVGVIGTLEIGERENVVDVKDFLPRERKHTLM